MRELFTLLDQWHELEPQWCFPDDHRGWIVGDPDQDEAIAIDTLPDRRGLGALIDLLIWAIASRNVSMSLSNPQGEFRADVWRNSEQGLGRMPWGIGQDKEAAIALLSAYVRFLTAQKQHQELFVQEVTV